MALRTFGGGPADITSDSSGEVISGIQLRVFNAAVGGQRVTELYSVDGTPLPGVVTSSAESDKLGRIEFAAAEDYSVLFLDPGYGMRWVVPAREAFNLTAAAVAQANRAIELAENAVTHEQLTSTFLNPSTFPTVYPHQFGAKGDGSTDDTLAVQAAVDYLIARGGGILSYDPSVGSGFYQQHDIQLGPNITVEGNGCRIRARRYACFHAGSGTKKGYGAYTKNLVFRNIVFQGDFATTRQTAITFHHTQNVLIENCTWVEAMTGGHCLDLCGAKNVTIRSCKFFGYDYGGRDHAEAIQLDHSTASGLDNKDPAGTYDGLPCVNITVEDCVFDRYTKGSTVYEAPPPIGNHVHVQNLHENVRFLRNRVVGAHYTTTSGDRNGWIHTYGVNNFTIEGNDFVSEPQFSACVINLTTRPNGIPATEYANPGTNTTDPACPPVPSRGTFIRNNRFIGFKGEDGIEIITIKGLTGYLIRDITIEGNDFIDCYPEARKTTGGNYGSDPIVVTLATNVLIRGNRFRMVRRLAYLTSVSNLTVEGNQLTESYWATFILKTDGTNVIVRGNTLESYVGGINLDNVVNSSVSNNVLQNSKNTAGISSWFTAPIRLSGGSRGCVTGNVIDSAAPPSIQTAKAILFTGSHTGGLYGSNLKSGHTAEATVDTGSTVTAK